MIPCTAYNSNSSIAVNLTGFGGTISILPGEARQVSFLKGPIAAWGRSNLLLIHSAFLP